MTLNNHMRYRRGLETCSYGCCVSAHGYYSTACRKKVRENLRNGLKAHEGIK